MSFPRYPEYKDSGVEWLGEVPGHWLVMPLKRDIEFVTSGARGWAENYSDDGDLFLRIGNLTRDSIRLDLSDTQRVVVPDGAEVDRTQVQAGDILFSITAYLGSVAVVPAGLGRAFVSQHVALVRPGKKHCLPEWLAYVAISYVGKTHLETTGYGGTKVQLSLADVTSLPMVVPPIDEQATLATFLDRETAKIDALVAEQEKLIALLQEKRQAVISHAVTKGLDPNVPMKDSGVEWLGEVPGHWEVAHLKRRCTQITDGAHISPETDGGTHFFVSTKDVSADGIDFDGALKTSSSSYAYMVKTGCQPIDGDVLFSKDGTIGRTVVVRGDTEFVVASSLIIIRPLADVLVPEFLNALCQSWVISQQVDGFVKGAGLPRLSIQNLLKIIGVFPSIQEQRDIAAYLAEHELQSRALAREAESTVLLLQERRTALISAAVTGQIDVRGLVGSANAPDFIACSAFPVSARG